MWKWFYWTATVENLLEIESWMHLLLLFLCFSFTPKYKWMFALDARQNDMLLSHLELYPCSTQVTHGRVIVPPVLTIIFLQQLSSFSFFPGAIVQNFHTTAALLPQFQANLKELTTLMLKARRTCVVNYRISICMVYWYTEIS